VGVHTPKLERIERGGVVVWTDTSLCEYHGVTIAFSERGGGSSVAPYTGLNLAAHVGDDPIVVDENRSVLLSAVGLASVRDRLTVPEQVHGAKVVWVCDEDVGAGAWTQGRPAIPGVDALLTRSGGIPLLLCFADCVPIIMVVPGPPPVIAVAHAGWRGAAAGVVERVVEEIRLQCGDAFGSTCAYVGPHIGPCHYEVDQEVLSHFGAQTGTISAVPRSLDLGAVVTSKLCEAGIPLERQVRVDRCTAEDTVHFFSYRSEGTTGRHGALACIG